jgi:hypothetical protein
MDKNYDDTIDIIDYKIKTSNKCIDCEINIQKKSTRCAQCYLKT